MKAIITACIIAAILVAVTYVIDPLNVFAKLIYNSTADIPMYFDDGKWKEVTTYYNMVPHNDSSLLVVRIQ